jgi:hypothetical protein
MPRVLDLLPRLLLQACLALGAASAVLGCHTACKDDQPPARKRGHVSSHPNLHIDNCSDIPQGAIPLPVGTYTRDYRLKQALKAEADDFVIYYNEWTDGTAALHQYGADHLARIISRLPFTTCLVIVQPEPNLADPSLNAQRYEAVIKALTAAGVGDAANRVALGKPTAEGLFGEEAEVIFPRLVGGGGGGLGGGGLGGGLGGLGFGGGFGSFTGGFGGGFGGGFR